MADGELSARKGARFAYCILAAWAALGLQAARPAGAATINLCTETTGTSPCPLPGTSNPAGNTINVLPGNTADNFRASPGPAYLSPGVIEVQPGATFTNTGWGFLRTTGTGSLGNSGTVVNDAFLQVEDDGRIENRSGASLTTNVDLSIYDDGVLDNDGLVDNYGLIYTLIDPGNDPPGDPDDPTIDNQGTLNNYAFAEILNDGTLNNSGTLNNQVDASISSSGTIDNSGLFQNDGFIDNYVFAPGGGKILNSGDFRVSASGEIARAGTFYPFGTYTQTAGSTAVDGAVRVTTFDVKAGLVTGAGTIQGTVKIGDGAGPNATVDPGSASDDTAVLQIVGSLTLASDSELIIEIASLSDFDRLQVSGASILDGTLTAVLEGGFAPGLGETFTFLTASAVSGSFPTTAFPVFDGRTFALIVDPLGSAALEVVAIPEPTTLAMLLSGLALLVGARRRR